MKVIHDGDGAYEDVMALMVLLLNADVVAVTSAYGENNTATGAVNMARVCRFLNPETQIPVAYGKNHSIEGNGTPFPQFIREIADNVLKETEVPFPANLQIFPAAVDLMKKILEENSEKITIVATGALTNVAELLQHHPECKEKIEKIVIMGGAVTVPGNIYELLPSDNTVSEWNFFADPAAAAIVFNSGANIHLVPLDITCQMLMTKEFFESLRSNKEPALKLTFEMLTVLRAAMANDEMFFQLQFWDSLAAMLSLDPTIAIWEKMALQIDTISGQVVTTDGLANVQVAMKLLNPELAHERYKEYLTTKQKTSRCQFFKTETLKLKELIEPVKSLDLT